MKISLSVLFALAAMLSAPQVAAQSRYAVGDTVANFTLTERATGRAVSLADFAGKVVVLEWFTWWCPFCQAAAAQIEPGIVRYYEARGGNAAGVPVIHVSVNLQGGQEAQTQQFVNAYKLGLVLNDFDRALANRFQSGGQPIFAVINGVAGSTSHRQWQLIFSQLGYGTTQAPIADLQRAIDSVRTGAVVTPPIIPGSPTVEPPGAVVTAPVIPGSPTVEPLATTLAATVGSGATVQWQRNGANVTGATSASLTRSRVAPADTGIYSALVTTGGAATNQAFIVGLSATAKVVGTGTEVGTNILHANGNTFDQVLLQGAAASFTADASQVTRLSFVDLQDDIVQVEFSGAGTVSVVLENATGPAAPVNYNQASVSYMRGHAGIVVTGANETTNLSVFSVGRGNAVNQALFRDNVTYDGLADISFVAIQSTNGKFGGLRTANASYLSTKGLTGLYAPGVAFAGPVFVGDINASDTATPVLMLGSALGETRITGGNLEQANGRAVQVSGLTQLLFTAGSTSHNGNLTAKTNLGRLEQNGTNVTAQIVVNPTP